jgi:hypothetical protein
MNARPDERLALYPAAGRMLYRGKTVRRNVMETIKTALFETLVESAVPDEEGGYLFTLEGKTYHIQDTLEISKIATAHGYIIIY